MNRQDARCLCTLWASIIVISSITIGQIFGGNLSYLLLIILAVAGAVVLTIYYSRDKSWVKKTIKETNDRASAIAYSKPTQYVLCPECKHVVGKEVKQCQNCGHQM